MRRIFFVARMSSKHDEKLEAKKVFCVKMMVFAIEMPSCVRTNDWTMRGENCVYAHSVPLFLLQANELENEKAKDREKGRE